MGYGNLAYREDYYSRQQLRKPQKKQISHGSHRADRLKYIRYICAIIVMAMSAGYMISTFVTVNETKAVVAELESQLADMEAITSQKAFDLDHSIDLATIEEEATTRLGMQRPEKYQMIYVNVPREDVTEKTAAEVENAGDRISGWLKNIFGNIVDFFSIK